VIVVAAVFLFLVLPLIASYNGMVNRQGTVKQSFADLDSQLQRRNDLIPNLVAAVKGALGQEQAVFGELAKARASYAGATTPEQKLQAGQETSSALGRLLVIVENYPDLKSNANIQDLMTQLEGTENRIQQARRDYNGAVTDYNVSIRRFPRSLVAGLFGFGAEPLFKADPVSTTPPTVNLGNTPTSAR